MASSILCGLSHNKAVAILARRAGNAPELIVVDLTVARAGS
jgi:hypothetical protein